MIKECSHITRPDHVDIETWNDLPIDIKYELSHVKSVNPVVFSGPPRSHTNWLNFFGESNVGLSSDCKTHSNSRLNECAQARMPIRNISAAVVLHVDQSFLPNSESIRGCQVKSSASSINACLCGNLPKESRVWKDGPNYGRYFLKCMKNTCDYFQWTDGSNHTTSTKFASASYEWHRFGIESGYKLVNQEFGYKSDSILQGGVGDCWFLSALAVIAEKPSLVGKLVISKTLPETGKVIFKLFIDGFWREVSVDNMLPCHPTSTETTASHSHPKKKLKNRAPYSLVFSKAKSSQLWVPLLEKAYAKAHGSYEAISGGTIREALLDLTGAPCETIDFSSRCFDSELCWTRLVSFQEAGYPMGCSTSMSGEGLVGNHAYSILDVRELFDVSTGEQTLLSSYFRCVSSFKITTNTSNDNVATSLSHMEMDSSSCRSRALRLVRIRNPWGKVEWKGDFGADSALWTSRLRKLLDRGGANDGTFWMSWNDVLCRFSSIEICKVAGGDSSGSSPWIGESYEGRVRDVRSLSSCDSFQVTVTESVTWLYLFLIQKTKRGRWRTSEDVKYWYRPLGLVVVAEGKEPGTSSCRQSQVLGVVLSSAVRDTRPLELHLPPGEYRVLVLNLPDDRSIASLHRPQSSQPFVLRVYSSRPVQVQRRAFPLPSLDSVSQCLQSVMHQSIVASPAPWLSVAQTCVCVSALRSSGVIDLTADASDCMGSSMTSCLGLGPLKAHLLTSGDGFKSVVIDNSANSDTEVAVIEVCVANYSFLSPYSCRVETVYQEPTGGGREGLGTGHINDRKPIVLYHLYALNVAMPAHSMCLAATLCKNSSSELGIPLCSQSVLIRNQSTVADIVYYSETLTTKCDLIAQQMSSEERLFLPFSLEGI